ncbi:putative NAD(P)/FAD-binding protein YdhS [Acinetobacter calcoaceticus]|uniref:Putative NAD(P)/FAD-binding protein YdhS n=1 Tax=Acinetobacter calcoaceticus TaxID=471 RepID=A0A4R1XTU5_ACICA|nr:putative NAD(P)/FAD-binding protein YdhS [Acinetobacter calcoaceticus]
MYDIAIVGLGATGVSLLKSIQSFLHEQSLSHLKIAVLSDKQSFARGKAFGEAEEVHRVNTPPNLMSIQVEDPQGFALWLSKSGITDKYPPRLIYAQYLEAMFEEIKNDAHIDLTLEQHEVVQIESIDTELAKISLANHSQLYARRVILCLGSIYETPYPHIADRLIMPNQIKDHDFDPDDEIVVAGTGLTAIDCIRSLRKKGVKKVYVFSRNNKLPTPITSMNRYVPQYFVWNNIKRELIQTKKGRRLKKLFIMLHKEFALLDKNEFVIADHLIRQEKYLDYFKFIVEQAQIGELAIQDIFVSTRNFAHKIWKMLSEEEQVEFQQQYNALWAVWRHPVPMFVIEELTQHIRQKLIEIVKVHRIEQQGQHLILHCPHEQQIKVNYLVDGTGGTSQISNTTNPLLRQMLEQQLIQAHPCGGVRVNTLNFKVQNNATFRHIYCLGQLAKGELFSTNAFWYNSKCAGELAFLLMHEFLTAAE